MLSLLFTKAHAAPRFTSVTNSFEENFYGSGARTLPETIGFLINVLLSVAGVVIFFLIIYAGILWMTAGGRDEQLTKAKNILLNSIIGLIIILTSLAVSTFVQSSLINPSPATAPSQQGGGGSGGSNSPTGGISIPPTIINVAP